MLHTSLIDFITSLQLQEEHCGSLYPLWNSTSVHFYYGVNYRVSVLKGTVNEWLREWFQTQPLVHTPLCCPHWSSPVMSQLVFTTANPLFYTGHVIYGRRTELFVCLEVWKLPKTLWEYCNNDCFSWFETLLLFNRFWYLLQGGEKGKEMWALWALSTNPSTSSNQKELRARFVNSRTSRFRLTGDRLF